MAWCKANDLQDRCETVTTGANPGRLGPGLARCGYAVSAANAAS